MNKLTDGLLSKINSILGVRLTREGFVLETKYNNIILISSAYLFNGDVVTKIDDKLFSSSLDPLIEKHFGKIAELRNGAKSFIKIISLLFSFLLFYKDIKMVYADILVGKLLEVILPVLLFIAFQIVLTFVVQSVVGYFSKFVVFKAIRSD